MRITLTTIAALLVGWSATSHADTPNETTPAQTRSSEQLGTLHFAFDSSRIAPDDRQRLEAAAAWLAEHPSRYLLIEGYTDPVGTYAYNAGLATRRGENVRTKLLAMGADPARLVVSIYGEGQLRSSDHAENRRVVLRGTAASLDAIIGRALADGLGVVWGYQPTRAVVAQRDLGAPLSG